MTTNQQIIMDIARKMGVEIEIKDVRNQIEKPQPKKRTGRKLPKYLTPQQVEQLLAPLNTKCKSGLRNMAIFMTLYKAGLRASELCYLSASDVDLSRGLIYVQEGKGCVDRVIPIGDCLIAWLVQWDEIRPSSEYFFCSFQGKRLVPRYLNQALERLSEKSGIYIQDVGKQKPVSCHKLRHSFATDMLNKGLNLRQIQELLGHKHVTTTEIYTHVNNADLDKLIKSLG